MKSCKVYYLNIRGLKLKKLLNIKEKPEVIGIGIGIVETMLDAKDEVVMASYTIYRNDINGGGLLITIKDC